MMRRTGYHVVFCTVGREHLFSSASDEALLKELIRHKAAKLHLEIKAMEVMPNHVHLYIISDLDKATLGCQIGQLKGYSARVLRIALARQLGNLNSVWNSKYFSRKINDSKDERNVIHYILTQKERARRKHH